MEAAEVRRAERAASLACFSSQAAARAARSASSSASLLPRKQSARRGRDERLGEVGSGATTASERTTIASGMAEGRRSSRGREETWPPAATAAPDTATAMAMPMAAAAEEEEGVAELMVVVAAVVLAARSVLRMARQTAGSLTCRPSVKYRTCPVERSAGGGGGGE